MLCIRKALALTVLAVLNMMLPALAGYRDDARAISTSGGEDHTLVLTNDKNVWTCGPNGGYAFGENFFGILGTSSERWSLQQKTLVRVHDGAMGTESDCLEIINDIAAGWMHSLALDVNDSVWSWGWNSQGQLGIGDSPYETTPVEVLRGEQDQDPYEPSDYLKHIIGISAGRSGQHSLAVDANGYAYAWGRNQEGQCGNGRSGHFVKDFA